MQVRAFLQLGKNAGKDSISVAVDVATELMEKKGITPKFTTDELRDMISQSKCGTRGQSRTFHKLDRTLQWSGETISIKVPVIHLQVFPEKVRLTLAKSKYSEINDYDFTAPIVVYMQLAVRWTVVLFLVMHGVDSDM